MPSHQLHITLDELVIGKAYPEVHKFIDQYQPYLQSGHREYFHDEQGVMLVWQYTNDPLAVISARLHIILDKVSDKVGQEHTVSTVYFALLRGENPLNTKI